MEGKFVSFFHGRDLSINPSRYDAAQIVFASVILDETGDIRRNIAGDCFSKSGGKIVSLV